MMKMNMKMNMMMMMEDFSYNVNSDADGVHQMDLVKMLTRLTSKPRFVRCNVLWFPRTISRSPWKPKWIFDLKLDLTSWFINDIRLSVIFKNIYVTLPLEPSVARSWVRLEYFSGWDLYQLWPVMCDICRLWHTLILYQLWHCCHLWHLCLLWQLWHVETMQTRYALNIIFQDIVTYRLQVEDRRQVWKVMVCIANSA